jgi:hypothetical protein
VTTWLKAPMMAKTDVQTRFNSLVSQILCPNFKVRGYRKTGNNFRFYSTAGWGKIVNIQKSAFSSRDEISFTINTGLYLIKADTMFESAKEERFTESDCLIRKRIGQLNGGFQGDLWYALNEQILPKEVEEKALRDTQYFVIPYLDSIQSETDILNQIINERNPKSEEAIRTLFAYGYSTEAYKWLNEEIATTIYSSWRNQLLKLRSSLK